MAGKPVGTIFVELDLDASRYTKGQQKLLKDAQSASTTLEQNFKNLGIKSAGTFDLMRAKTLNSFEAIVNNAKSTANDIIRAEEAKARKLQEINDQQFGKQTSALEGLKKHWLAATAAIAAAVIAVNKAIEAAKTGALLEKQERAFGNLARAAGTSASSILTSLKSASNGMIAEADLMAAAGKAMLMSIPAEKISDLMRIAAATSRMTGQTITEAFNDITLGVARQSRMILDNLGIIVDVDKANQDYARSINKTAAALNDAEKRQAFMNAVLKSGDDMIRRLGNPGGAIDGVTKATAEWNDIMGQLAKRFADESNPLFEAVASVLRRINLELKAGSDAAKEYGSSIGNIDARIAELNKKYGDMESRRSWGYNEAPDVEYRRLMAARKRIPMEGTTDFGRGNVRGRFGSLEPEYYGARRVSENEIAYDAESAWKSYIETLDKAKAETKKFDEVNKAFWGDYKKEIEGAFEFEKFQLDAQFKEYDKYVKDKAALNSWYQAEKRKIEIKEFAETAGTQFPADRYDIEAQRAKAYAANAKANLDYAKSVEEQRAAMHKADQELSDQNWWKTYVEDTENATRENEIFTDSMNIMSQSAADAFAEFVTGTKSASDAFRSMVQSMVAAMVRISSQKAFEELFGMISSGAISLISGWSGGGSTPTGMGTNTTFSGGGTMGGYMGMVKHSGGLMNEGGPARRVPAMVFANAPRYHDGLAPDEIATILRRDEGVFTPGQMKALGGRSVSINVPVSISSDGVSNERRLSARMRDEVEATAKRVLSEEMR